MSFFSAEDWPQEVAALVVVGFGLLYLVHHLTGWPRRRARAPEAETPDDIQLGGRLAKGLAKAEKRRRNP